MGYIGISHGQHNQNAAFSERLRSTKSVGSAPFYSEAKRSCSLSYPSFYFFFSNSLSNSELVTMRSNFFIFFVVVEIIFRLLSSTSGLNRGTFEIPWSWQGSWRGKYYSACPHYKSLLISMCWSSNWWETLMRSRGIISHRTPFSFTSYYLHMFLFELVQVPHGDRGGRSILSHMVFSTLLSPLNMLPWRFQLTSLISSMALLNINLYRNPNTNDYYPITYIILDLLELGHLIHTINEVLQVLQVHIVGIPHIPLNLSLSIEFRMTPIPISVHLLSYPLQQPIQLLLFECQMQSQVSFTEFLCFLEDLLDPILHSHKVLLLLQISIIQGINIPLYIYIIGCIILRLY